MLCNKNKKVVTGILILFGMLLVNPLFAKKNKKVEVFVSDEESESAEEKWQQIEWYDKNPEFVLYYEVVIEAFDYKKSEFVEHLILQTEDNTTSITVNPKLIAGLYRYKVIPYNLLGLKGDESKWTEFKILTAYQPAVESLGVNVNHTSTIFLEEYNDGIITIEGKNLFKQSIGKEDFNFTTYTLKRKGVKLFAPYEPELVKYEETRRDGAKIEFKLNLEEIDIGTYNLVATDASGLVSPADKNNEIVIKFKKWLDIDIAGGLSVPVVLFDDTIPNYMGSDTSFGGRVWYPSFGGKLTVVPWKHTFGYIGIGVTGTYTRMFSETSNYSIDGNLIFANGLLVYQVPISWVRKKVGKKVHVATFELHAGGGIIDVRDIKFHFPHGIDSEPLNSTNIDLTAGISWQQYIGNRLYLEFTADFLYAPNKDMQMGFAVPSAYVGWQF